MLRLAKWLPRATVLAGALMLGTASPACADTELMLSLTDGANTVTGIYDFSKGYWVDSGGNQVSQPNGFSESKLFNGNQKIEFSGVIGGYTVDVSTSTSNVPGSSSSAFVNTDNSNVSGSGNGLTIITSAENFTSPSSPPAPALLLNTNSSVTGNSDLTTVTYTGSAGTTLGGNEFTSVSGSYTVAANSATGSGPSLNSVFRATSYTLTDTLSISAGDVSLDVSGRTQVTPLPEPSSMMAAFTAVPFLAIVAWLRRRKLVAIA